MSRNLSQGLWKHSLEGFGGSVHLLISSTIWDCRSRRTEFWNYRLTWETVFARALNQKESFAQPSSCRGQYWRQPEFCNCARCFLRNWQIVLSTSHIRCPRRRARGTEHWKSDFDDKASFSTSWFLHSCKTSHPFQERARCSSSPRSVCKNLPESAFEVLRFSCFVVSKYGLDQIIN